MGLKVFLKKGAEVKISTFHVCWLRKAVGQRRQFLERKLQDDLHERTQPLVGWACSLLGGEVGHELGVLRCAPSPWLTAPSPAVSPQWT